MTKKCLEFGHLSNIQPESVQTQETCPKCDQISIQNSDYCPKCGKKKVQNLDTCPKCGQKNFQKPNTFPKSVQSLDTISLDPQMGYENVQIVFKHLTLLMSQFGQVSKFQTHLGHIFGQVSKFWTHLGHILVKCPNSRHFFGHILDTCPNSENCLVTFWSSVQILDTFWSYFGHLPQVWTHFGLILDTFCPKCVYTHIVQEHPSYYVAMKRTKCLGILPSVMMKILLPGADSNTHKYFRTIDDLVLIGVRFIMKMKYSRRS